MNAINSGYRVCDIMTRKPVSVTSDTGIAECAVIMQEKGVGSLVVKEGDRLIGYITEHAIVAEVIAKKKDYSGVSAGDIMSRHVPTVHPNEDVLEALNRMREQDVRQLPVIDSENGDKLVGLLTLKDILNVQPQIFEIMEEKMPMQEEERKRNSVLEGTCDECGEYSQKLVEKNGSFVCAKCASKKL